MGTDRGPRGEDAGSLRELAAAVRRLAGNDRSASAASFARLQRRYGLVRLYGT